MIRILTEQMDDLNRTSAESFLERLTAFICAETGDTTKEEVSRLVARAGTWGFTLESTIAAYVIAARLLGEGFEERLPAARALLGDDRPEELRAFDLESLTIATLSPTPAEESEEDEEAP